jgi:hypothetical protein
MKLHNVYCGSACWDLNALGIDLSHDEWSFNGPRQLIVRKRFTTTESSVDVPGTARWQVFDCEFSDSFDWQKGDYVLPGRWVETDDGELIEYSEWASHGLEDVEDDE